MLFCLIFAITAIICMKLKFTYVKNIVNTKNEKVELPVEITLELFKLCLKTGYDIKTTCIKLSAITTRSTSLELYEIGKRLEYGQCWDDVFKNCMLLVKLKEALKQSYLTGASAENILNEQVKAIHREKTYLIDETIEKLSVKIILPLGLCYLPSFIFIGIIPIVIALLK